MYNNAMDALEYVLINILNNEIILSTLLLLK